MVRCAALAALGLVLVAAPAAAQTYKVKVTPKLHNLNIKIAYHDSTGVLVMKLTNKTDQKVRCDLSYDAAPQTPKNTTVFLAPGEMGQSALAEFRHWFTVNVAVDCRALPAKAP